MLKDILVGDADIVVSSLLAMSKESEGEFDIVVRCNKYLTIHLATINLRSPSRPQTATLYVRVSRIGDDIESKQNVDNALRDVADFEATTTSAKLFSTVESVQKLASGHTGLYGHIGDLVQKLDAIKAVIDEVARVSFPSW